MPSNNVIESSFLWYRGGTADKVYHVYLKGPPLHNNQPAPNSTGYRVVAHYGRRGGKLKEEIKANSPSYYVAKGVYDRLIATKTNTKGYRFVDDVDPTDDPVIMDIEDAVLPNKVVKFKQPTSTPKPTTKTTAEVVVEGERKLRFGAL